ncbi:hypothetical protein [Leptothoe sp. PORK10 BA2]|uniref:hypothetical protein n=1 Tax=Leptothoe sp. PORK10 BA2 TaxID=3110254 RepID=UPI002B21F7AA|nr:hypothetical protein [Leptothoe sp. PORK10 BA2]MEA5462121.1 hypothetical protein [Leptothoe sp. PORK10 BA2]
MLSHPQTTQSLDSLMSSILNHRRITRETQRILMQSLLGKNQLNRQEQEQVQKIFEGITQGRLRVID